MGRLLSVAVIATIGFGWADPGQARPKWTGQEPAGTRGGRARNQLPAGPQKKNLSACRPGSTRSCSKSVSAFPRAIRGLMRYDRPALRPQDALRRRARSRLPLRLRPAISLPGRPDDDGRPANPAPVALAYGAPDSTTLAAPSPASSTALQIGGRLIQQIGCVVELPILFGRGRVRRALAAASASNAMRKAGFRSIIRQPITAVQHKKGAAQHGRATPPITRNA